MEGFTTNWRRLERKTGLKQVTGDQCWWTTGEWSRRWEESGWWSGSRSAMPRDKTVTDRGRQTYNKKAGENTGETRGNWQSSADPNAVKNNCCMLPWTRQVPSFFCFLPHGWISCVSTAKIFARVFQRTGTTLNLFNFHCTAYFDFIPCSQHFFYIVHFMWQHFLAAPLSYPSGLRLRNASV